MSVGTARWRLDGRLGGLRQVQLRGVDPHDFGAAHLLAAIDPFGRRATGLDRLGAPLGHHRPPLVEAVLVFEAGGIGRFGRSFSRHPTNLSAMAGAAATPGTLVVLPIPTSWPKS